MRTLGLDYGEKRIGVAVSDPLGITAQGLPTLPNRGKENFIEELSGLCGEYQVGEIIIGLPINMDGSLGPKAKEVLALAEDLKQALPVSVKTWDERLSSRQAGRLMIEGGLSRAKQKKASDRIAATIVLQNYLESKRGS